MPRAHSDPCGEETCPQFRCMEYLRDRTPLVPTYVQEMRQFMSEMRAFMKQVRFERADRARSAAKAAKKSSKKFKS